MPKALQTSKSVDAGSATLPRNTNDGAANENRVLERTHIEQNAPNSSVRESQNSHVSQLWHRELPQVDLVLNQIRYDGVCHNVTSEGAKLVDLLVKAPPYEWVPTHKVFSKPSRVKNSLPAPIRNLIETDRGKGYRLKPY